MTRQAPRRPPQPTPTPPAGGVLLSGLRWSGLRWPVLSLALLVAACTGSEPGPAVAGPTVADGALLAIPVVQGSGATSPFEGRQVEVEGVVTAPLRGLGGFMLQDPDGDGRDDTSDALFVAWDRDEAMPRAGDRLRVAGRIVEPDDGRGVTTLVAEHLAPRGTSALPAALVLSAPPEDWEALEGMRVRVSVPLMVSGNHALARHGELQVVFGERLWQPTEVLAPGPGAAARAEQDGRRLLVLDDARRGDWPSNLWPLPEPLSASAPLRAGSRVHGVEGVVDQRFGNFRLQLTTALARIEQAPRPAPPEVPGAVRLAVFNVLNLFNGDGRGGGFPTARGARTPADLARQRDKLVAALTALDADILALLEIENDGHGAGSSLADLALALDAAVPGSRWQPVAAPNPGVDAIQVALLYRADRVRAVGRAAQLARGPFATASRPPLAQAFAVGEGAPLVVAVNHFKSKGGCEEARGADRDQGDGQGCHNATRVASARRLHAWLDTDPTGTGPAGTLLLGDFNAYAQEDPMRWLRTAGWTDAFALAGVERPYSYVYRGEAGRLDHALLDPGLAPRLRGAAVWHVNADEAERFDYRHDPGRQPWRASDHDPLLLGLDLAR